MKQQEQSHNSEVNVNNVHWTFWLGLAFFVVVIIGLISFSWFVSKRVNSQEALPVTNLVITGEMPYTQTTDIQLVIDQLNMSNFFNVDVNKVQKVIANLPWVYSVAVRKKWPNELKIYIVDQKPIAMWNGDFLLNEMGNAFQADKSRLTHTLPSFFGPEGSEQMALMNYHNINRLLKFSELEIDELVLSERFAWQLTLNDGVMLNLGRENRIERVQRFMDVYPNILKNKKSDQQVNYVDLRYDTGLAVGWKPLTSDIENKRA